MTAATARLRDLERTATLDALAAVDASAPTLCHGWSAHDLAAHLWSLDHPNAGWTGIPLLQRIGYAGTKARWPYAELVGRLRNQPSTFRCMPLDPLMGDGHATGEWFVHGEDVRRANGLSREYSGELQELLWRRVRVAARLLHRDRSGLALQTPDGHRLVVRDEPDGVVVTGEPTELMLWTYGRREVADVRLEPMP